MLPRTVITSWDLMRFNGLWVFDVYSTTVSPWWNISGRHSNSEDRFTPDWCAECWQSSGFCPSLEMDTESLKSIPTTCRGNMKIQDMHQKILQYLTVSYFESRWVFAWTFDGNLLHINLWKNLNTNEPDTYGCSYGRHRFEYSLCCVQIPFYPMISSARFVQFMAKII